MHIGFRVLLVCCQQYCRAELSNIQVADLRLRCLKQLLSSMRRSNVLEYAKTADLLNDQELMNACLTFWKEPENRSASRTPIATATYGNTCYKAMLVVRMHSNQSLKLCCSVRIS